MIDWSGALEAVHTDGRVVRLERAQRIEVGTYFVGPWSPVVPNRWTKDGTPVHAEADWALGWSIRNVQPAAEIPVDDMKRLVHTVAGIRGWACNMTRVDAAIVEARRIAALLAPPVPAATLAVREIVAKVYDDQSQPENARQVRAGTADDWPIMAAALAAYAAGK